MAAQVLQNFMTLFITARRVYDSKWKGTRIAQRKRRLKEKLKKKSQRRSVIKHLIKITNI